MTEPLLDRLEAAWNSEEPEVDIPLRELIAFLRDITARVSALERILGSLVAKSGEPRDA